MFTKIISSSKENSTFVFFKFSWNNKSESFQTAGVIVRHFFSTPRENKYLASCAEWREKRKFLSTNRHSVLKCNKIHHQPLSSGITILFLLCLLPWLPFSKNFLICCFVSHKTSSGPFHLGFCSKVLCSVPFKLYNFTDNECSDAKLRFSWGERE